MTQGVTDRDVGHAVLLGELAALGAFSGTGRPGEHNEWRVPQHPRLDNTRRSRFDQPIFSDVATFSFECGDRSSLEGITHLSEFSSPVVALHASEPSRISVQPLSRCSPRSVDLPEVVRAGNRCHQWSVVCASIVRHDSKSAVSDALAVEVRRVRVCGNPHLASE